MDLDTILFETEDRMSKSLDYLSREMRGMRTGRATTALLDYVKVDYYGSQTDLRELAGITVPEPTQLLVKPFDPSSKQTIVKAIEVADLGLNPQVEGNVIRIHVPPPSAERRKLLVGQIKKMAEEQKVAIRNERRDANKHIDMLLSDKKNPISDDQAEKAKKEVDDLTKSYSTKIDEVAGKKIHEVEEI